MSLACPTAENNCLAETASSLRCIFNSLRPDATAPRRYDNNFDSGFVQLGDLVGESRHAGDV